MVSIHMAKNAKYTFPYMLISVRIKNSHGTYNDHINDITNQPTV